MKKDDQPAEDSGDQDTAEARNIAIRLVKSSDFDQVMQMLSELIAEYPSGFDKDWAKSGDASDLVKAGLERQQGWVAEQDGALIGHIGWRTSRSNLPQRPGFFREIVSIYVDPDHRGSSLARRLFEIFLADCDEQGVTDIRINALPDPTSIALLESLGFVERHRIMTFAG